MNTPNQSQDRTEVLNHDDIEKRHTAMLEHLLKLAKTKPEELRCCLLMTVTEPTGQAGPNVESFLLAQPDDLINLGIHSVSAISGAINSANEIAEGMTRAIKH